MVFISWRGLCSDIRIFGIIRTLWNCILRLGFRSHTWPESAQRYLRYVLSEKSANMFILETVGNHLTSSTVFELIFKASRKYKLSRHPQKRKKLIWLIGFSKESFCVWDLLIKILNQDLCKRNFLEKLKSHEVLIHVIADWTMIYLPKTFRETQSEWFGKQTISWHMKCVGICHPHLDDIDNSYTFKIPSMIPLIY